MKNWRYILLLCTLLPSFSLSARGLSERFAVVGVISGGKGLGDTAMLRDLNTKRMVFVQVGDEPKFLPGYKIKSVEPQKVTASRGSSTIIFERASFGEDTYGSVSSLGSRYGSENESEAFSTSRAYSKPNIPPIYRSPSPSPYNRDNTLGNAPKTIPVPKYFPLDDDDDDEEDDDDDLDMFLPAR